MEYDPIAEKNQDQKAAAWLKLWSSRQPEHLSMHLAQKHRPDKPKPVSACFWKSGAFNICYRVRYCQSKSDSAIEAEAEAEPDIIIRYAALGRAILRREKVQNEVSTMNYLRQNTSIPVPEVFGHGVCWAGPYIVMSFVEGVALSELLRDRDPVRCEKGSRPVLNPGISESGLRHAYREMAAVVLELSRCEFEGIGALEEVEIQTGTQNQTERKGNGTGNENDSMFTISRRPLTFNMNELMASANIPEHVFPPPRHTFSYSSTSPSTPSSPTISYFQELATQHLHHLKLQQRNSTTSASDCRRKYTARCLFLDIVTNKLHMHLNQNLNQNLDPSNPSPSKQKEGFKLYCDDLRPSNVLIDTKTGHISGVIDWEFTYAAPSEFTTVAPWWLLLQSPEDWEDDLHDFLNRYRPRLKLFLEVLKKREEELIAQNRLLEEERLSIHMQRSIAEHDEGEEEGEEEGGGEGTGLFWICLAARYSSMFDEVYWGFLDERFFGSFTSLEQRMGLLSEEQRLEMEALVREKMGEWDASEGKGEEGFVDHYPIDRLLEL